MSVFMISITKSLKKMLNYEWELGVGSWESEELIIENLSERKCHAEYIPVSIDGNPHQCFFISLNVLKVNR